MLEQAYAHKAPVKNDSSITSQGDFQVNDKSRLEQPKKFEDNKFQALLHEERKTFFRRFLTGDEKSVYPDNLNC